MNTVRIGDKVKLIKMPDDPKPVPFGTVGKVVSIDDIGTVHVKWENGQGLGLVKGIDVYEVLKK